MKKSILRGLYTSISCISLWLAILVGSAKNPSVGTLIIALLLLGIMLISANLSVKRTSHVHVKR